MAVGRGGCAKVSSRAGRPCHLIFVPAHQVAGELAGLGGAYGVLLDPADGHDLHGAVGEEDLVGFEELGDVDGCDFDGDAARGGEVEDGLAGDAGQYGGARVAGGGGDGGVAQVGRRG